MTKNKIKIGDVFGQWEVIGQGSKPYYSKCRCTCGTIRDVSNRSLCAGESNLRIAQKKVDTSINGFKIVSIFKKKGENVFYCKAICPVCGKETETKLSRLKKIICV